MRPKLAAVWTCPACRAQMMGQGPRCFRHNPPPRDDRPYIQAPGPLPANATPDPTPTADQEFAF